MSYIDAYYNREQDIINVVERDKSGNRNYKIFKPDYSFYYADPNKGSHTSLFGEPVSKIMINNYKTFQRELKALNGKKLYESDIKPVFKCLEQNYLSADIPDPHCASLDIEVDFCKDRGFAPPTDPHQPITAITLNFDWLDQLVTLVLKPKGLELDIAQDICSRFDNCILFTDEVELLKTFYEIIDDVDIFYTWNGEGFDIPYIINRTIKILGKEYTRKFSLWSILPKKRTYEKYGKENETYDIFGRLHLDYLNLYRKYTFHEQPSYRLDYIGEVELNERKIQYEGTLDQLYNEDFEKFIAYNRQDTMLLTKLDKKLKFISLTNVLAHENCVPLPITMGPVALTDQAVILEVHRRGMVMPNRSSYEEGSRIAGAYVADPKQGLQEWVFSCDINSLYPSTIRALNMSVETLFAQVRHTLTSQLFGNNSGSDMNNDGDDDFETIDSGWDGVFACLEYDEILKRSDQELIVDFSNQNESVTMKASEIYDWVFAEDSNICISANGTIFRTDIDGVIPDILASWYAERKIMQKKQKEFEQQVSNFTGDKSSEEYKELQYQADYWAQRQHVKKILLNIIYGAVTNPGSRFSDQRIGQSTTLTGRCITRHMLSKCNELITGSYDYLGDTVVYGDTDSAYISIGHLKDSIDQLSNDTFIDLADSVADQVNESFSHFMCQSFNVEEKRKDLIKCGREICASRVLFVKKKKYAAMYFDKEGIRKDKDGAPGELKIMGLDTQRADTPKPIQDFLKEILFKVLNGESEKQVIDYIREFRGNLKELKSWEKGTPKRVNNLTKYIKRIDAGHKFTLPGHARASLNWNTLRKLNGDNYSMEIMDGQKVLVCRLKNNPMKYTSIAIPIDQLTPPEWFKELPFDDEAMETALLDAKLQNIIGVLNWDLDASKMSSAMANLFIFE